MFAWCYGIKDIANWFKALWHLGDDQLQMICGTDYTLYLIFLRMAAMLLLGITVINGFIMVPLYTTGEPMPSDDYNLVDGMSNMNAATILNITGSSNKMIFAFICAIVVIPSFAFAMIYRFR